MYTATSNTNLIRTQIDKTRHNRTTTTNKTSKHTNTQTNNQTNKQTSQTDKQNKQANKHTNITKHHGHLRTCRSAADMGVAACAKCSAVRAHTHQYSHIPDALSCTHRRTRAHASKRAHKHAHTNTHTHTLTHTHTHTNNHR